MPQPCATFPAEDLEHRKTRQRRVEILESAATAFRRRGYHGASMGEIARALRMTKGSLYYYFKNKEEILFFCHDYSLDILLEHARAHRDRRADAAGEAARRSSRRSSTTSWTTCAARP